MNFARDNLMSADFYIIICEDHIGADYIAETELHELTSRSKAVERVKQNDWARVVIRCTPHSRADISEDIARDWLKELVADGWTAEDALPRFIGRHLSNDDIEAFIGETA
jgi:hypothetical protein